MPHLPSAELVAVAWLKTLDGVPSDGVATTLPGDPTVWAANGFVQVGTVGGSPAVHTPLRTPVVQVDCWANNSNSAKSPWGKSSALAELVVAATYSIRPRLLVMPEGFHNARLNTAWPLTEPRRIPGDEAGFARVNFDLALSWVVAE